MTSQIDSSLNELANGWLHGRFSLRWVTDHRPKQEQVRHRQLDHYTLW